MFNSINKNSLKYITKEINSWKMFVMIKNTELQQEYFHDFINHWKVHAYSLSDMSSFDSRELSYLLEVFKKYWNIHNMIWNSDDNERFVLCLIDTDIYVNFLWSKLTQNNFDNISKNILWDYHDKIIEKYDSYGWPKSQISIKDVITDLWIKNNTNEGILYFDNLDIIPLNDYFEQNNKESKWSFNNLYFSKNNDCFEITAISMLIQSVEQNILQNFLDDDAKLSYLYTFLYFIKSECKVVREWLKHINDNNILSETLDNIVLYINNYLSVNIISLFIANKYKDETNMDIQEEDIKSLINTYERISNNDLVNTYRLKDLKEYINEITILLNGFLSIIKKYL